MTQTATMTVSIPSETIRARSIENFRPLVGNWIPTREYEICTKSNGVPSHIIPIGQDHDAGVFYYSLPGEWFKVQGLLP